MKLQDLDKTKRYDLSECTDEELLCVLNWLQNDDKNWLRCDISDLKFHQLEYSNYYKWFTDYLEFTSDMLKPTFIKENKQEQFLSELQQLCKKYNTEIDAVSYDNEEVLLRIITDSVRTEIIGISGLGIDKFLTIRTQ